MKWERWGFLTLGLILGGTLSAARAQAPLDTIYRKLEILAQVLVHVENDYVEMPSPTELIYGAARGITSALDAHSAFFSPEEYRALLEGTEGEYAGIGIELDVKNDVPEVVAVFEGSPALEAGIKSGDKITQVDDQPTAQLQLDDVSRLLQGQAGSAVTLQLQDAEGGGARSVTLLRSWVRVNPVEHHALEHGLYYVRIKTFARRVSSDLEQVLHNHPPRGLVLDLRGNPGGLFEEALAVCDLFLADGPIVTAVGRGGRIIGRQTAKQPGTQPNYKIAVLIDGGSASASEIVAGALHDRGRARLFGNKSYGKGSVQSIFDLVDGSGLKLTVARYITPSGAHIDGKGIMPDVVVLDPHAKADVALAAALRWLE